MVRELQRRLAAAGFAPSGGAAGRYDHATAAAVQAFQAARGLQDDGVCDAHTWEVLVEAAWSLGDRALYHRSPNLRGDDVAELQRQLGQLGFDPGRVDGIFGLETATAVAEFQQNVGLEADGVCTLDTLQALRRLGERAPRGPGISRVREEERLRHPRTLVGLRVVVGELGGLEELCHAAGHALRREGAVVLATDEPDQAGEALLANHFAADVYLGLRIADEPGPVAYYATTGFESVGGHRLAELLHRRLSELGVVGAVAGMRLPVLRETKMPAVLCTLGPVPGPCSSELVAAITVALTAWAGEPRSG